MTVSLAVAPLTATGVTAMPLTDSAIRNAKPKDRQYKLTDGSSLYLLITPKGGKWWRLDYRFKGKRKTLSMGVYPDVSLKAARDRRSTARKQLVDGINPSEARKATKASQSGADSLEAVAVNGGASMSPTGRKPTPPGSCCDWRKTCSLGLAQGQSARSQHLSY